MKSTEHGSDPPRCRGRPFRTQLGRVQLWPGIVLPAVITLICGIAVILAQETFGEMVWVLLPLIAVVALAVHWLCVGLSPEGRLRLSRSKRECLLMKVKKENAFIQGREPGTARVALQCDLCGGGLRLSSLQLLNSYRLLAGLEPFVTVFSRHCGQCRQTLEKSLEQTSRPVPTVYTVQSSYAGGILDSDDRNAFDDYLERTVPMIMWQRHNGYRRLVLIPDRTDPRYERVLKSAQLFARKLVISSKREYDQHWRVRIRNEAAANDYSNQWKTIQLGVVHEGDENALRAGVYGAIDIHLPSDNDFAIAWFPGPTHAGGAPADAQSSGSTTNLDCGPPGGGFVGLHMRDPEGTVATSIRNRLNWLWGRLARTERVAPLGDLIATSALSDLTRTELEYLTAEAERYVGTAFERALAAVDTGTETEAGSHAKVDLGSGSEMSGPAEIKPTSGGQGT